MTAVEASESEQAVQLLWAVCGCDVDATNRGLSLLRQWLVQDSDNNNNNNNNNNTTTTQSNDASVRRAWAVARAMVELVRAGHPPEDFEQVLCLLETAGHAAASSSSSSSSSSAWQPCAEWAVDQLAECELCSPSAAAWACARRQRGVDREPKQFQQQQLGITSVQWAQKLDAAFWRVRNGSETVAELVQQTALWLRPWMHTTSLAVQVCIAMHDLADPVVVGVCLRELVLCDPSLLPPSVCLGPGSHPCCPPALCSLVMADDQAAMGQLRMYSETGLTGGLLVNATEKANLESIGASILAPLSTDERMKLFSQLLAIIRLQSLTLAAGDRDKAGESTFIGQISDFDKLLYGFAAFVSHTLNHTPAHEGGELVHIFSSSLWATPTEPRRQMLSLFLALQGDLLMNNPSVASCGTTLLAYVNMYASPQRCELFRHRMKPG